MELQRGKEMLYLNQETIVDMGITMKQMIELMEKTYAEKGMGKYQMPAKTALHTCPDYPGDFIHTMPAFIPEMNAAGVKIVSGYENARKMGYPYIAGLYLLNDTETGIPLAMMDCIWMTMVRTGAVTGLTAKYLANKDSEVVGLIGTGVQGRINIDALMCVMDNIKTIKVFDHFKEAAEAYKKEIEAKYNVDVVIVDKREDAVIGCDLLLSCIPCSVEPGIEFITGDMIKEGATALPVDDLVLYKPETCTDGTFSKCFTDDQGQFIAFQNMGFFRTFKEVPLELGELVIGKQQGRTCHDERILTVNIGTGLADVATARILYDIALEKGLGMVLPL